MRPWNVVDTKIEFSRFSKCVTFVTLHCSRIPCIEFDTNIMLIDINFWIKFCIKVDAKFDPKFDFYMVIGFVYRILHQMPSQCHNEKLTEFACRHMCFEGVRSVMVEDTYLKNQSRYLRMHFQILLIGRLYLSLTSDTKNWNNILKSELVLTHGLPEHPAGLFLYPNIQPAEVDASK